MKRIIIIVSLLASILFALVMSCDVGPTVNPSTEINENVRALAKPVQPPYAGDMRQVVEVPDTTPDPANPDNQCITYNFKINLGFTDLPCFNPSTTIIWPGALIDGASIVNGTYRPIIEDRKPLTISCSIANTGESVLKSVDKPSLSSMRDAINEIVWKNRTAPIPAMIDYKFLSIYSKEHLKVELGINANASATSIFGSIGGSLENRYDWESTTQKTKLLVKFVQAYYSCDIDVPPSPVDFFTDSVKWDDIKNQITTGITPGYVSSIKYGRILLFFMQSEKSEWEVKDAFAASVNISCFGVTAGGSTTLTTQQQQVLEVTQITAIILGGDSITATPVLVNLGNLGDYLTSGLNATANTPVVPLSYQVNYMSDNTWMILVLGTDGKFRDCNPAATPAPFPTETPTPATTTKVLEFTQPGEYTWYPTGFFAGYFKDNVRYPMEEMADDSIIIEMVGGGGGGGGALSWVGEHCNGERANGYGGKAGSYITEQTIDIDKSLPYKIFVGAPGANGDDIYYNNCINHPGIGGGTGGLTSFGMVEQPLLTAPGGDGGGNTQNGHFPCEGESSNYPGGVYGEAGNGHSVDCSGKSAQGGYIRITYTAYVQ